MEYSITFILNGRVCNYIFSTIYLEKTTNDSLVRKFLFAIISRFHATLILPSACGKYANISIPWLDTAVVTTSICVLSRKTDASSSSVNLNETAVATPYQHSKDVKIELETGFHEKDLIHLEQWKYMVDYFNQRTCSVILATVCMRYAWLGKCENEAGLFIIISTRQADHPFIVSLCSVSVKSSWLGISYTFMLFRKKGSKLHLSI